MINVRIRTNRDAWKTVNWPKTLQVLPRVGEYIATNESGNNSLRVVMITHHEKVVEIEVNL